MADKVIKTEEEWKAVLSPEAFRIARKQGTERAFTGAYWDNHAPGTYSCVCCGQPLFSSTTKFDSGTGWPSFFRPITEEAVASQHDWSHNMHRVEALCSRCDAHLGHVFEDGPAPTGLRFCMNSGALHFQPE